MQIILRMFINTPSCKITVQCDKCSGQMQKDKIAPIIYPSDIKNNDLDMTKLGDLSMTIKCRVEGCSGRKKTSISELGDIIIFEVFNAQRDVQMKLDDLPRNLRNPLNTEESYRLVGKVDFIPPVTISRRSSSEHGIGHFKAVCLQGVQWVVLTIEKNMNVISQKRNQ
ncbi:uncharacterized protein LOC130674624 [Microplitis mediator]|uniref:uncharacterized protein LOC130674624 n=1 Tax=Microplitis mediator TaxID=375433 RepID=UPI002556F59B|nr:uncharacterized protein LOC130674624 [Microplitis mediator]